PALVARGCRRSARRPGDRRAGQGIGAANDRDRQARRRRMTPTGQQVNALEAETPTAPRWEARADAVVLGSGAAGLTAALRLRELGVRVLVVTKAGIDDGNTRW